MLHFFSISVEKNSGEASRIECFIFLKLREISSSLKPVLTYPILSPSSSNSCQNGKIWISSVTKWWKPSTRKIDQRARNLLGKKKKSSTSYDILSTSRRQSLYRSYTFILPDIILVWNIMICREIKIESVKTFKMPVVKQSSQIQYTLISITLPPPKMGSFTW